MEASLLPAFYCERLSGLISDAMGLHFPHERWGDLQRGLSGAAQEFGFEDVRACADWLLSAGLSQTRQQVLASHLTIGETYFFRDKATLSALADHILPQLIQAQRGGEQRLRIWSAACCSGEEAYTLAILLHRLVPDLADWNLTIQGTDINPRFLHKAKAGVYGDWSFRDVPPMIKERYFTPTQDGLLAVIPEIRRMVSFSHMNLVEDVYPSPVTGSGVMDLILCRNVLMYFTPPQIQKVIGKLRHALKDEGWLVVSPSEASPTSFLHFNEVHFPGAILFQKATAKAFKAPEPADFSLFAEEVAAWAIGVDDLRYPAVQPAVPAAAALPESSGREPRSRAGEVASAASCYEQGRYAETVDLLVARFAASTGNGLDSDSFSLLVRALANQGKLAEALVWSDRWLATDTVNPAGHYLRALVLLEQDAPEQARLSLERALFLQPGFALAHFSLGNLARGRGKSEDASRHFSNALRALQRQQPGDLLPESNGLTATRLAEIITSMHSAGKPG